MAKFSYRARDKAGSVSSGEIVAGSAADAVRLLRAEGRFVVHLGEASEAESATVNLEPPGRRRVKSDEVIYFLTQLSGMIDTGVPIDDALQATIDRAPPGAFRRTVEDVVRRVQGGSDLSASLGAHPKVFPPLLVHMVRVSEATGAMGAILTRVAEYMINQREIKKKIKGALTYPLAMLTFAVGATIFMLTYVLPKFATIYASKQAALPLPTRILIGISDGMVTHWFYLLGGATLVVGGLVMFIRSPGGGYAADWVRLNAPLLGPMFRKAAISQSLRTLGTMINAGVSVLEGVAITRDVVGNRLFKNMFRHVYGRLQRGDQLSDALLDAPYLPRPIWQMLNAGERTGHLGPAMERVADLCESDLRHAIRTMTQFIEPTMIVVMGVIVGGIALGMLLPIFQISRVMTH